MVISVPRFLRATHELTFAIATSYVTLGIFDSGEAERLWAPYAGVMFVLAILNLRGEQRERKG